MVKEFFKIVHSCRVSFQKEITAILKKGKLALKTHDIFYYFNAFLTVRPYYLTHKITDNVIIYALIYCANVAQAIWDPGLSMNMLITCAFIQ